LGNVKGKKKAIGYLFKHVRLIITGEGFGMVWNGDELSPAAVDAVVSCTEAQGRK
jgi:hypothetical protein